MSLSVTFNVIGMLNDISLIFFYYYKKDQISKLKFSNLIPVSKSQILGGPTIYINSGSTLNLTCLVLDTPGPPDYLFWYHNGQVKFNLLNLNLLNLLN